MNYRFIAPAREELLSSVKYYERIEVNLGLDFLNEVEQTIDLILLYPEHCPQFNGDIRKAVLRRFPFNILYTISDSSIIIIALMHQKRKPGYWKDRKSE